MHTAAQLAASMFEITLGNERSDLAALFPEWNEYDRFGVLLRLPFESLGASLLIQAAITQFYDWRRCQLRPCNVYPELVFIHVGGQWGDHSYFDAWPARKELFVGDSAYEILFALNQGAVTRLALPAGAMRNERLDYDGTHELLCALDRIRTVFHYDATGTVANGDVRLAATSATTEANVDALLAPEAVLRHFDDNAAAAGVAGHIGRWLTVARQRQDEVPALQRAALRSARNQAIAAGLRVEHYRRVTAATAFAALLPWDATQLPSSAEMATIASLSTR